MKKTLFTHSLRSLLVGGTLLASTLSYSTDAVSAEKEKTSITIYSKAGPGGISPNLYRPVMGQNNYVHYNQIPGYAMVRKEHNITLDTKRSEYSLTDVAAFIDPTTVSFKSLTAPQSTSVLEQNFMFDLVSLDKLAARFIDKDISFDKHRGGNQPNETISGKLLSVLNNQLIVQKNDGTITSTYANAATFPSLPGEFYTKPTLKWDLYTDTIGDHRVETSYQTDGITWWADYNAVYSDGADANHGFLDLGAWVSILNKSGGGYDDAKLKLVAGDVHRATAPARQAQMMRKEMAYMDTASSNVAGFEEKSFFEFHLYTLGRPTSIPDNSTKQLELFPKVNKVPVEKKIVYYGADKNMRFYGGMNQNRNFGVTGNKKVDVYIEFKNEKEHGLGMPLPAGKLRVSKLDSDDGSLEFIGEDNLDHTPKNEKVLLKLGSAFDIVGERKQLNFNVNHKQKYLTETYEVTLRNHKNESVDVIVKEPVYRGANWTIYNQTAAYDKIDAHNIQFPVTIPKDGEKKVSYTVKYTWE